MALSSSPRKTVPLATGDEPRNRDPNQPPGVTRRVFYSSVVVEGSEHGVTLRDDIQELVVSLGHALDDEEDDGPSSSTQAPNNPAPELQFKRATTDKAALKSVIDELVSSEQTYVNRLQVLKNDYADPLRNFAKSKETAIIQAYEAKLLFGNIDALLPVNEAFLADLRLMQKEDPSVGDVGDVALKHFKELSGFDQYKLFYPNRESAQEWFEKEASKRTSQFMVFINNIKYSSGDSRNRVGLRELLMEPVQRIPRYTLLFKTMLKSMGPHDPMRAKIEEATAIASKIALAEADDPTKRAAIFHCMTTTIEGFPPGLYSSSRKFIDCIDVQDILSDAPGWSGGSTSLLHCTLILFDDKLLIVKRPNGDKGVKTLTGLDNLEKVTKGGTLPPMRKKSGMSTKAVLDITEVVANDPGGARIHLYLEKPPFDQTERWSGRPYRSLVVVKPPASANFDPIRAEAEKKRFLENLWEAQARYRAAGGKSVVLLSKEELVEERGDRKTFARTYWNVFTRLSFLQDPKKTKVVVHIDPTGTADPIPFGVDAPPYVNIKLQPMPEAGVCRYSVTSADNGPPEDEEIVMMARVPSRIIQTIHQYRLFHHKTGGKYSVPGTPTTRSRFGLDTISKKLWNDKSPSGLGDFFGGTITSHRRTKSATSRSSVHTNSNTNSTADSSLLKSARTHSTAPTSVDDADSMWSRSSKGRAPNDESNPNSLGMRLTSQSLSSLRQSLAQGSESRERNYEDSDYSDMEEEVGTIVASGQHDSDLALQLRLDLARQNSLQHGKPLPPLNTMDLPVEETIYEEEPPEPLRKRSMEQWRQSPSPTKSSSVTDLRPLSRQSGRPAGPRGHSPLPSTRPHSQQSHRLLSDDEGGPPDSDSDPASDRDVQPRHRPSGIPRSNRQIFPPTGGSLDATPRASTSHYGGAGPSSIEPLSIKKKVHGPSSSLPSYAFPPVTPTPKERRSFVRDSPLSRSTAQAPPSKPVVAISPPPQRISSPSYKHLKAPSTGPAVKHELVDSLVASASQAREQLQSSQRAVRRVKAEIERLPIPTAPNTPQSTGDEPSTRPSSPDKLSRVTTPPTLQQAYTKEAKARFQEMQNVIGKRQGDSGTPLRNIRTGLFEETPRSRDRAGSVGDPISARFHRPATGSLDRIFGTPPPAQASVQTQAREHAAEADTQLSKALETQESLERDLRDMAAQFKEKLLELERTRLELANAKRQTDLVKQLLQDATTEKEIMYEALNEELDAMFNDAHRPGDDAYNALTDDLRKVVEERNELAKEKSLLKRNLAEAESRRDEYEDLLRKHGLLLA